VDNPNNSPGEGRTSDHNHRTWRWTGSSRTPSKRPHKYYNQGTTGAPALLTIDERSNGAVPASHPPATPRRIKPRHGTRKFEASVHRARREEKRHAHQNTKRKSPSPASKGRTRRSRKKHEKKVENRQFRSEFSSFQRILSGRTRETERVRRPAWHKREGRCFCCVEYRWQW